MNYIKIDQLSLKRIPPNYTYFIEVNDNNTREMGVAFGINKDKLIYGKSHDGLWQWTENYKFSDDEIEKYKISKEEFQKKFQESIIADRKGN